MDEAAYARAAPGERRNDKAGELAGGANGENRHASTSCACCEN
jgi:hypothetical protein